MIQCSKCNSGEPHLHQPSTVGCQGCADLQAEVQRMNLQLSEAKAEIERLDAESKEENRLCNVALKEKHDALLRSGKYRNALAGALVEMEYVQLMRLKLPNTTPAFSNTLDEAVAAAQELMPTPLKPKSACRCGYEAGDNFAHHPECPALAVKRKAPCPYCGFVGCAESCQAPGRIAKRKDSPQKTGIPCKICGIVDDCIHQDE